MTVENRKSSTTQRNIYDIVKQDSDDMFDELLSSSSCFSYDEEEENKKAKIKADNPYDRTSSESTNVKWKYICIFSALIYTVFAVAILVPSNGKLRSPSSTTKDASNEVGYTRPKILYGNLHIAKTGGTSLNGIMANKFERVCGHKGYSYNAYSANERAKEKVQKANTESLVRDDDDAVPFSTMHHIGYEDCDYISTEEEEPQWWIDNFGDGRFHNETENIGMQLHVPCRDPIDHLMSQCNSRRIDFDCDAENDEEFYESIEKCFLCIGRYSHSLRDHFDVKCFDFRKQFTDYIPLMAKELQGRRFVSEPFVKRETNRKREKAKECIWKRLRLDG